ncbi:hypothetical protein ACFVTC_25590 [Streptomyces sp. NPDC057950]|uniref:hypothetical protein n=1 Tax=Streptomyces sp. NPDC057950 TaxID=3346288 RepID=UPI0036E1DB9D
MHDASGTARHVTGGRRPTVRALLVAVLLALFTTFAVGGPPAGRADRVGGGTVSAGLHVPQGATGDRPGTDATDHRPGVVPREHEECAAVRSIRASGRHGFDGERPTPPSHPATIADATAVPPATVVRTPPVSVPAPHSSGPAVHDRGRAPPASSGI